MTKMERETREETERQIAPVSGVEVFLESDLQGRARRSVSEVLTKLSKSTMIL
jgi:hypothetical protein